MPSSHSRSNATIATGTFWEARLISRSLSRFIRCWRASNEFRPSSSNDLRVDHGVHLVHQLVDHVQLGVLRAHVPAATRDQPRRVRGHVRRRADPVELRFEPPPVVVERLPAALGEHRRERRRARDERLGLPGAEEGEPVGPRLHEVEPDRGSGGRGAGTSPSCRSTRALVPPVVESAPRRPSGPRIVPWNEPYSSGWSSVRTARRLSPGWSAGPGGRPTMGAPSRSRRTSKCSRVAGACGSRRRCPRHGPRPVVARSCPRVRTCACADTRRGRGPSTPRRPRRSSAGPAPAVRGIPSASSAGPRSCGDVRTGSNRSPRSANRSHTVSMRKSCGVRPASTSSQVRGVERVAPGSGRIEYTAEMFAPSGSCCDR